MSIIFGILSLIGSILWIAYLYQGLNRGKVRGRGRWMHRGSKKAEPEVIETVRDPKDAAVLLMLGIAECEGVISTAQKQQILEFCRKHFSFSDADAAEIYASCSFILRKTPSLEKLVNRMAPIVADACSDQEKRELLAILEGVATADGTPANADQQAMIARVKNLLKI